jgi:protein-tyrosine phosphatase
LMAEFDVRRQVIELEGSFNVRDLGGYPTRNGSLIQPRRFLRAGSLHSLSQTGRQTLLDLGVRCIIDLRSQLERKQKPDPVEGDPEFFYHHVPMLDYINSTVVAGEMNFPDSMEEMYFGLLDHAGHSFAKVFELFAHPDCHGFLFHCTAGKDRTGMVAMLLLALAGVEDDLIVADYSISQHLVPPTPGKRPHYVPAYALTSPPEAMRATLGHLNSRYGGAQRYLSQIGVTPQQKEAVLAKLLEE